MNCKDCGKFWEECKCDDSAQSRAGEAGANLTDELADSRRKPTKVVPGSELHLSLLMAKYGLNFVTGQDRQDLLAWGRDVWDAAKAANAK